MPKSTNTSIKSKKIIDDKKTDDQITRIDKLKALELDGVVNITDTILNHIYDFIIVNKCKNMQCVTRKEKLKILKLSESLSTIDIDDNTLNKMYLKALIDVHNNKEQPPSREEKLKTLGLDENYSIEELSNKLLDELYSKIAIRNEKIIASKRAFGKPLDKDHPKYQLLLEFLNAILVVLKKNQILELSEFKNIKKDDILQNECKQLLDKYMDKLLVEFGKENIRDGKRIYSSSYILNVLKTMTNLCGFSYNTHQRQTIKKQADGNHKRHSWVEYSIS